MTKGILLAFFAIIFFLTSGLAQNISNEGRDFWAVFPTHVPSGDSEAEIAVFVTAKTTTVATVSCNFYTQTKTIPANTAVQFNVPRFNAYVNLYEANSTTPLINRGIHIKVADDQPKVSVYAHIYGRTRSAASLILPFESLGQTYYAMNYTQNKEVDGNNYLVLVAAEDNTDLVIQDRSNNTKTIHFDKAGDVYEYISGYDDLTGTIVTTASNSACKKFAAFSGSTVNLIGDCNFIFFGNSSNVSFDPLYQQLSPVDSWGKDYGIIPFKNRRYIIRILAQEDNTVVKYNGNTITLNKGQYAQSEILSKAIFVSSNKLISVAQYALSQLCSGINGSSIFGDPDMVILNPIEFNIKDITVFSSTLENITQQYINVIMPSDKTASFKIDGKVPDSPWEIIPENPNFAYNQISVSGTSNGQNFRSLSLKANDGFNAIAYGFGQFESYAYSAGTNLLSTNYLTVINRIRKEESDNGCLNVPLDLKITLPYQPDKLIWKLDDNDQEIFTNLNPIVNTINGKTTYSYVYPVGKIYTETGQHKLLVTAQVPNNQINCVSGTFDLTYLFKIFDLPTASFDLPAKGCINKEISFTDQSNANSPEISISSWLWDFKDGQTSTEQNPKHLFKDSKSYDVTLLVKSSAGCYSDPISKKIDVYPIAISNFSSNDFTCINTPVVFKDLSTTDNSLFPSKIVKWVWDFGDGNGETKTDIGNTQHVYAVAGNYTVKLIVQTEEGCDSKVFEKIIKVQNLPKPDFALPDVCIYDAEAVFINQSTDDGASNENVPPLYTWDFGDSTVPAEQNISNEINGKHHYQKAGEYTVTLTLTNSNGCTVKTSKKLLVNGQIEKAEIIVENEANLCSSNDVVLQTNVKANFGKIVKLEIYQDYHENGENSITKTIAYPSENESFALKYPEFGGNEVKKYRIKMVAYTGSTAACTQTLIRDIIVKPVPQIVLDDFEAVCENAGMVQLNNGKETSGMLGNFSYRINSGGLSPNGQFYPDVAGAGLHQITYTFTGNDGCAKSLSKNIVVNQAPFVDAGNEIFILANGEAVLPATAVGKNLRYEWTPAIGLSDTKVLNPIASPNKDTEYTLKVFSPIGCVDSSKIKVKVIENIKIPNAFSPNGDNINDDWYIQYLNTYPKVQVEVFNRYGSRVFYSEGYKNAFDGNYQNTALPVGVYYYIIRPNNGRKNLTGSLTIIR